MKEQIVATLAGYARASEFMERERMQRLAQMTAEEAQAIYNDLTARGEKVVAVERDVNVLDAWRIETRLAVRQAMMQLARQKGWL